MLKFYWVGNEYRGNFGDVLTPRLLDYFNIDYKFVKNRNNDFDAICIGSIFRHAKPGTIVLGSGLMSTNNPICITSDIRFIRGPHTRELIIRAGGECPKVYGDPALLLPMFCNESKKEHDFGIIPHIDHYQEIKEKYPNENVISLRTNNALDITKEITKCRKIISGSLHGIIAAHAYNIPAAWVDFGRMKGDGIKFRDHYSSIGLTAELSTIENPKFEIGNFNTKEITTVFESLKDEYN
jgi:pyruvyltransferase